MQTNHPTPNGRYIEPSRTLIDVSLCPFPASLVSGAIFNGLVAVNSGPPSNLSVVMEFRSSVGREEFVDATEASCANAIVAKSTAIDIYLAMLPATVDVAMVEFGGR